MERDEVNKFEIVDEKSQQTSFEVRDLSEIAERAHAASKTARNLFYQTVPDKRQVDQVILYEEQGQP